MGRFIERTAIAFLLLGLIVAGIGILTYLRRSEIGQLPKAVRANPPAPPPPAATPVTPEPRAAPEVALPVPAKLPAPIVPGREGEWERWWSWHCRQFHARELVRIGCQRPLVAQVVGALVQPRLRHRTDGHHARVAGELRIDARPGGSIVLAEVQRDVDRGQRAMVNQTPILMITYKLKQQPWAQWADYGLFRSYVDDLLKK
jgi:hypothetical protein